MHLHAMRKNLLKAGNAYVLAEISGGWGRWAFRCRSSREARTILPVYLLGQQDKLVAGVYEIREHGAKQAALFMERLNIRYWLMSTQGYLQNNLIVITHTHLDDSYAIATHQS